MSHGDSVEILPDAFEMIASTKDIPVAAYKSKKMLLISRCIVYNFIRKSPIVLMVKIFYQILFSKSVAVVQTGHLCLS